MPHLESDKDRSDDNVAIFPFLKLPAELRQKVYVFALQTPINAHPNNSDLEERRIPTCVPHCSDEEENKICSLCKQYYPHRRLHIQVALLRVCRLLYKEASPVLYETNCFTVMLAPGWSYRDLYIFVTSVNEMMRRTENRLLTEIGKIGSNNLALIRHLTLFEGELLCSVINQSRKHWGFKKSAVEMIMKLKGLHVLRLASRWNRKISKRSKRVHLSYAERSRYTSQKDNLVLFAADLAMLHTTLSIMYYLEARN